MGDIVANRSLSSPTIFTKSWTKFKKLILHRTWISFNETLSTLFTRSVKTKKNYLKIIYTWIALYLELLLFTYCSKCPQSIRENSSTQIVVQCELKMILIFEPTISCMNSFTTYTQLIKKKICVSQRHTEVILWQTKISQTDCWD